MGKYINQTSNGAMGSSYNSKREALIADGAKVLINPTRFVNNMVCVVNNGHFAAAAYVYSEGEFVEFSNVEEDPRPKTWFIWDKVKEFAA
jgi:hypothetical protein